MKLKDVISSVCFVLVFLLLFNVATYAMRPVDKTSSKPTMSGFYSEPKDSLDIIAIGSSSTYRYVVPMELYKDHGYTAYTMAIASMRGNLFKYFIREAEKTQDPDLYILDLRWFVKYQEAPPETPNALGRLRMSTDNLKISLNRIRAVHNVLPKNVSDKLSYYIDIIKYHDNWQSLDRSKLFYNKPSPLKGFRSSPNRTALNYTDYTKVTEAKELSDYSRPKLIDLLDFCKKEKINVLFTFSPYLVTEENIMHQNTIEQLVKSYGYNILNTNKHIKEMGIDFNSDYYNSLHTNAKGAVKYTKYLGDYISKNYDIDTEHPEKITKAWNKTAEDWEVRKKHDIEAIWDKVNAK